MGMARPVGDGGSPSPLQTMADGRNERNTVIDVQALVHTYRSHEGEPIPAISQVDLTVREGEFLSIVGPTGCGKSTLLKIAAGLIRGSSGKVLVQGRNPMEHPPECGFVFQSPVLLPWRSVIENVALPLEIRGVDKKERFRQASELLNLVKLGGFEGKSPRELSGGMQQRVNVARGLSTDPPLLLLDEPFGALDAMTREQLNVDVMEICARTKKTTVLVTHSIAEAVLMSDRVAVMSPRPGTIRGVMPIGLERPRSLRMTGMPEFGRYQVELRDMLSPKDS